VQLEPVHQIFAAGKVPSTPSVPGAIQFTADYIPGPVYLRVESPIVRWPLLLRIERMTALFIEFVLQFEAHVVGFDSDDDFADCIDPPVHLIFT
jgi:hypothetical protein